MIVNFLKVNQKKSKFEEEYLAYKAIIIFENEQISFFNWTF